MEGDSPAAGGNKRPNVSLADDIDSDDSEYNQRGNMEEDEMHQAILASLLE